MSLLGWAPHSVTPSTDLLLWLRWLVAVILVWWMPGWILLRGRLRDWPAVTVAYAQVASGLVWVTVLGLVLRWAGRGFDPWLLAAASPLAAFLVSRIARRVMPAASGGENRSGSSAAWWWVALSSAGLVAAVIYGFRNYSAPPTDHDASNHAFLVARAMQVGSLDPSLVFGEFRPQTLVFGEFRSHSVYFAGWHFVAAITGAVAGVAPYIATWFASITALAMIPCGLAAMWRRWGLGIASTVVATFWLMSNAELPAGGPYSFGGLGIIVGFAIVPAGALLLAEAARTRRPLLALAAGALLAAVVHTHFSEVVVIPLLAIVTIIMRRREDDVQEPDGLAPGSWWGAAVSFAAGCALAYDPSMLGGASDYTSYIDRIRGERETVSLARALRSFPEGIGPPDLRFPWAVGGTLYMLATRRWRPVAVASLALGFWVFALKFWFDPVSTFLAIPFYAIPLRVAYQQLFFLPLAAGVATVSLVALAGRRSKVWATAVAIVAVYIMGLGYSRHDRELSGLGEGIPFGHDEYGLAGEIADFVPAEDVIANFPHDGSLWAWHVSGSQFLIQMSWPFTTADGTDLRSQVLGLRDEPWSEETLSLEDRGIRWLYVSADRRTGFPVVLAPEDFEGDPRFTVALERDGTRLLRINWPD